MHKYWNEVFCGFHVYIQQSILLPSLSLIPFYMQIFVYMVSKVI